jgi:hypothetical protein
MVPAKRDVPGLDAFLHGEVDNKSFHHVDHVRVAFEILGRHDFPDAVAAYSTGLKSIARRAGNPGAYHETITVAFLSLIAERRIVGDYRDFSAFVADNADLLDKSVLGRWYTPERLQSETARRTFVLPSLCRPARDDLQR